ncbi:MAG: hypothetical protein QMD13_04040 [Candidatus Bathyarchaeia archaeon]|nr:hypothetical protein [Candidatus Bathyarchaeia archaeon]
MIRKCGNDLAYIDNRRDAKQKYGFDFWRNLSADRLKTQGIEKRLLYSESQQFPDFLFKVRKHGEKYIGGSLIELKDSKNGSVASFNSTIPTKHKSLEEIDVINSNNLVSRIAAIKDGTLATNDRYFKFERRCFYLVRTRKESKKVKVSIVDGSFFETVPKEHLFYQMFLNVLRTHMEKKKIEFSKETLEKVEEALSHITDQTIIASSQIIEGASVRPRLRIMAEVHPEGNPHSKLYPEIAEESFNLILQSSPQIKKLEKELPAQIPEIEVFSISHKRNGKHTVFQFRRGTRLSKFL